MRPVADFLSGFPPFDELDDDELEDLAAKVEIEYFPAGAVILEQGAEPISAVWVIRSGAVELRDRGRILDRLEEGELFGHPSALAHRATSFEVRAGEDALCYRLPAESVVPLLGRPAGLRFLAQSLLSRPRRDALVLPVTYVPAEQPAASLVRSAPVVCAPDTPVRDVAQRMAAAGASAALIELGGDGFGIITDSDLRQRVLAAGLSTDAPASEVMSAPASTVGPELPGSEVILVMLDRGIRHVPVVSSEGEPLGVLVAVELLATQTHTPFELRRMIEAATTEKELQDAAERMRSAVIALHEARVGPTHVMRVISIVVEALTRRFFDMSVAELGPPPADYGWVAAGSLGRREMSPGSDIDSALTWSTDGDPEESERYGIALGELVVAGLAACGFAADTHGATAGQPFFCRSVDDWRHALRHAIEEPTEEKGLFMLSLALDARVIAGADGGFGPPDELRRADHRRPLQGLMLRLALAQRPPTGFLRDLVVEDTGEHRGQLDIKHGGLLPVTDFARYGSLAVGARTTSTPERLRVASTGGVLAGSDTRVLAEAFDLFWRLRLEHQVEQLRRGEQPDDYLDPEHLNALTRTYLRDAFHAIRKLQRRFETELVWSG